MHLSIFDQYQDRYLAEEEAAAKAAGFKVFFPSHVAYLSRRKNMMDVSRTFQQGDDVAQKGFSILELDVLKTFRRNIANVVSL